MNIIVHCLQVHQVSPILLVCVCVCMCVCVCVYVCVFESPVAGSPYT